MSTASRRLNQAILEVVDNQIRDNDPPVTRETFDRLVAEGFPPDHARSLIGCVVASEIFDVLTHQQPYNEDRFVKALRNLPALPEPSE